MNSYVQPAARILKIGILVYCLGSDLKAQTVPVQVIDDKSHHGVKCDIYKFEPDEKKCCVVASTDDNGKGDLKDIGKSGETLRPVHLYYEAKSDVQCPVTASGPLVIEVHKAKYLSKHAAFLVAAGRPAAAAYVYERAGDQSSARLASKTNVKTIEAIGDALGAKDSVVEYHGKPVPSDELVVKIKDLQTKEGITADGRLNPKTLKAAVAVEAESVVTPK